MSWGDTQCVHDGYKLSRQEKWQTIANFFESRGGVHVQSCGTPGNCNDCFHCARNIVGLILEGLDPEKYGYEIRDDHFGKIRENIEEGTWELDADHRFFWEDIQQHIPNDLSSADIPDGSESFIKWLLNENLKKYEPAHS